MADLLPYALTTVNDVKETLGLASSDHSKDNLITRKINQATEMIEGYTDRRFKETTYTEYYDATQMNQLLLRQFPIKVVSVAARDTVRNVADFSSVDSDLYFIDYNTGILSAIGTFYGGYSEWRVTYTAGYATIPADLAEAAATLAAYLVNDPSTIAFAQDKREGARQARYVSAPKKDIFGELGIQYVLDRYSYQPLSGQT